MILGIGIDALDCDRFQRYVKNVPSFLQRTFSQRELSLTNSQLAGNFSAKEAFFKACPAPTLNLITGIEILRDSNGKPFSIVKGYNDEQILSLVVHISLTNLSNLIISTVVIENLN